MSSLMQWCQRWGVAAPVQHLGSLLYPPECVLCQVPTDLGQRLCSECVGKLVSTSRRCSRCAMPLPSVIPDQDCWRCREHRWKFSRIIALGNYRGKLREAVILCKKKRFENLRDALARQLAQQIRSALPAIDQHSPLIVPVPNYWSRVFAQAAPTANSLAQLLGRHSGWPVTTRTIRRVRKTEKQGMLSLGERQQNVRGAFKIADASQLTGRHVLIVDDVLTTGSTADEMAKLIRQAKPLDISVVVIARATGK